MKRLIIGIAVLLLLPVIGGAVSWFFCQAHIPTAALLADASEAALANDWDSALSFSRQARNRWERFRHLTAAFTDHSPIDEIDSLFSQLETFEAQKSGEWFPALCAQLSELTKAIADSHRFCWWTVL